MPPEQDPESQLKQIRTFQGDVAEALKKQQESLVSIQRREHIKTGPPLAPEEIAAKKKRRQFLSLSLGSIVLIILGVTGAWWSYQEFITSTISPLISGPANRFVSAINSVNIDLKNPVRDTLIINIAQATGDVPAGELSHVILVKTSTSTDPILLTTKEFLDGLETGAPGTLVRALDPLFMLGAIGIDSNATRASTFLIIKLASFENAFAGMLEWENTLARDIGPLFATAPMLKNLAIGTTFKDLTDRNKDIRVLELEGRPILLYSFFDNEMLIITDSVETMRILVERLTREKLSR